MLGALYARVKAFDPGKKNNFYGAFPYSLKERVYALFPDCQKVCHVFSGTVQDVGAVTFDVDPLLSPTICDDIRNIALHKELCDIDLFIADPPYERSDFEKYRRKPFNKPMAIRDIGRVAKPNSYLVWLDTRVPIYNKKVWELLGYIGVVVSTNTRMRCLTLLHRTRERFGPQSLVPEDSAGLELAQGTVVQGPRNTIRGSGELNPDGGPNSVSPLLNDLRTGADLGPRPSDLLVC